MTIRVYYEDTDLGGVVYYANYLKFCERARSELFFSEGDSPVIDGFHFIVKSLKANYLKPAKFADLLDINTQLLEQKKASVLLLQEVYREKEKLFSMQIELVCMEGEKISRIPEIFQKVFTRLPLQTDHQQA